MAAKRLFQLCVSVFAVKAVLSQSIPQNRYVAAPAQFAPNCNIPMVVPSAPIEVSVSSDNLIIDGCIEVVGTLPFYGGVLVEGMVPNRGEASVFYECGNGNVGIELPTSSLAGNGARLGYNPGFGFNNGGCGCA